MPGLSGEDVVVVLLETGESDVVDADERRVRFLAAGEASMPIRAPAPWRATISSTVAAIMSRNGTETAARISGA